MKKIFIVFSLFLFLSSLFLFPGKVFAQACCPDTQDSQYKYQYDPSNNRCYISGPQGRLYVDSNCTSDQVCNTSINQCEKNVEPSTLTGCSTDSTGRKFCARVTGPQGPSFNIYCSSQTECDEYIASNPYASTTSQSDKDGGKGPLEGCPENQINTAIGCIPIGDTNKFIGFILRWAIGIGGGIAFLLSLFAGFQIMTSSGNPERLKAGQELLTSAIAGLILLIFSVFILKIIGVDILQLPGFGQ